MVPRSHGISVHLLQIENGRSACLVIPNRLDSVVGVQVKMWQYNLETKVRRILTGKFGNLTEASIVLLEACEPLNKLPQDPKGIHYISDNELAWLDWINEPSTLYVRARHRRHFNDALYIYIPCEVKK